MKKITKNTILKQGNKVYQPIEVDGVIYWIDVNTKNNVDIGTMVWNDEDFSFYTTNRICKFKTTDNIYKVVAQSQPKLEEIPVISLDSYVEKMAWEAVHKGNIKDEKQQVCGFTGWVDGYKSNPNQYTQKDIEIAFGLGAANHANGQPFLYEVFKQLNSISAIEVDEQFNIISYE